MFLEQSLTLENGMAHSTIVFQNPNTGVIKEAPVGFSWTVFFFDPFVPAIRGDLKFFIIMFIAFWVTWGLSALVFMFIYNNFYIKELINRGFKAKSSRGFTLNELSTRLGLEIPRLEDGAGH